ncbi:transcription elongation regulator, partial [Nowakowskiella sp. JEL0078]
MGSPPPTPKPNRQIFDPLDPNFVDRNLSRNSRFVNVRNTNTNVPVNNYPPSGNQPPRFHNKIPSFPPVWTEFKTATGQPYFYNSITKQSVWQRPLDLGDPNVQVTIQNPQQNVLNQPELPKLEQVYAVKKIPETSWLIAFTTFDHEFFFDLETKQSLWDIPDQISDIIAVLIADGENNPDENKINDGSDDNMENTRKRSSDEEDSEQKKKLKTESVTEALISHSEKIQEFKDLLQETDVNPYSPWEKELPKFVADVRYTRITHKERKRAFDEFCRVRVVEMREEKKGKDKDNKNAYTKLLEEETTYRSNWEEFSRKFKNDPHFLDVDLKEREDYFKKHITKLREVETEKRRLEMKEAKDGFLLLLAEKHIKRGVEWSKIRRELESDKRYQAVRTANEREEIFKEYIKQLSVSDDKQRYKDDELRKIKERKAREAASLKERQEHVRQEKSTLTRERDSTRSTVLRKEAIDTYKSLLIDYIRTHNVTYSSKLPSFERDNRWSQIAESLNTNDLKSIFDEHIQCIYSKRIAAFYELVEKTCSPLATYDDTIAFIQDDVRVANLGLAEVDLDRVLRKEFAALQKRRVIIAREELERCLVENRFLEFHVRNAVQTAESNAKEEKKSVDTADESKFINMEEIKSVLKDDKRWNAYQIFPEDRVKLLKDHIDNLVSSIKAEKGGTIDRVIAIHAGGLKDQRDDRAKYVKDRDHS